MQPNFLAILVAALSTMPVGFIWYNPKVFGTIWMNETGMTKEKSKTANMFKVFSLAILFAFMISMIIQFLVIHQFGALGMTGGDPALAKPSFEAFMADYGHAYRTFKHGMLHGFIAGIFLGLPMVGTQALFEMKSWKYILINGGYWIVCFTLMGGIICAWE
jgi:hypothetical protein